MWRRLIVGEDIHNDRKIDEQKIMSLRYVIYKVASFRRFLSKIIMEKKWQHESSFDCFLFRVFEKKKKKFKLKSWRWMVICPLHVVALQMINWMCWSCVSVFFFCIYFVKGATLSVMMFQSVRIHCIHFNAPSCCYFCFQLLS